MPPSRLDTIGKLHQYGYGLTVHCERCAGLYRKELGPKSPPSSFSADLPTLIAERGDDYPFATGSFEPIPCAYCGSRRTEIRLRAPSYSEQMARDR